MKKLIFIFLAVIFIFPTRVNADYSCFGVITDASTSKPIPQAVIQFEYTDSQSDSFFTKPDGSYNYIGSKPIKRFFIGKTGYKTLSITALRDCFGDQSLKPNTPPPATASPAQTAPSSQNKVPTSNSAQSVSSGSEKIPGLQSLFDQSLVKNKYSNLGQIITSFIQIIFYFVVLGAFLMIVFAAVRWMFSGGNKEIIAKSRARITYAIVGLIIFILAYSLTQYITTVFQPKGTLPFSFSPIQQVYAIETVDLKNEYGFGDLNTIGDLITRFIRPLFIIAGIGIVFFFLFAAFRYITSGGDKDTLSKARGLITQALIGFVILMLSFIILQFILGYLFNIKVPIIGVLGV